MEKARESKVKEVDEGDEDDEGDEEDKDEKWESEMEVSCNYIPFYPTLDSNGSNRVLDQPDSTLSNDSIQ
ncbi:hypothetical protein JCGZ_10698 [Jatropha curcas]|uniref:Uncharacterized protein n=1 Tax=Jatropha curcas TaxID=180498 RepID=A0A067KTK7_JATCU|nr:hypothetical protein JCGZ_10698 [Jatropha curcas]